MQRVIISDPGGNDRLYLQLWDRPAVDQAMRGQYIEAIAAPTKNGPRGVQLVYEGYSIRRDMVINVYREAMVTIAAYTPTQPGEQTNEPPAPAAG